MKQYAVSGNGTRWDGIDAGLKKYIGNVKRFSDMTAFWNEVSKGNRVGVVLFRSGTAPDSTVWTSSGHYVAFVNFKVTNGKHYLYTKDSGGRLHDGWYCYETSMKGCIQFLWTAVKPGWYKDGSWYYYKTDGTMVKNDWVKDKDKWYFLGSDGRMYASKWIKWKDNWYYLKDNGVMATSEWVKDDKGWCYLNKDGKMLAGQWVRWRNNMYYLKGNGYMQTEAANIPCKFDETGKLIAGEN